MTHNHATQWRFTALDTLFFRESRPMEAIGGAQLQSVFPPPAATLIGAIRTAIGEAHQVDWNAYAHDDHHPLKAIMGSADSLGPLSCTGPFLMKEQDRLFPVPLALLHAQINDVDQFTRLTPSTDITVCDLGAVRLPQKRDPLPGAKPLEQAFITAKGLATVLRGNVPEPNAIVYTRELYHSEERLGIGRDYAKRTTIDSLLYQTNHVRPVQNVSIGMVVKGLDCAGLPQHGTCRLGAEGRMAAWQCEAVQTLPPIQFDKKNKNIMLVLLTPARFTQGWLPDGFTQVMTADQQTVWEGNIHGVALRLISSVTGKPMREGGWDLVNRSPRTMHSLVPAGSCYFCEVLGGAEASTLHGQQIGQDTEYGRGEIAIGHW